MGWPRCVVADDVRPSSCNPAVHGCSPGHFAHELIPALRLMMYAPALVAFSQYQILLPLLALLALPASAATALLRTRTDPSVVTDDARPRTFILLSGGRDCCHLSPLSHVLLPTLF